jgi:hypothetical protein
MLRGMIVSAGLLVALVGAAGTAQSEVRVSIGINLPAPPALVVVPATPVMYAPSVRANYFFYGGEYFVFTRGAWYASAGHNGPWMVRAPEFVPRPILAVPVRYYRVAPGEWRHAKREGPPPWAPAWGRKWEEHRGGPGGPRGGPGDGPGGPRGGPRGGPHR